MDTKRKVLVLTPMLSRPLRQVHVRSSSKPHTYSAQKVEDTNTSDVFAYTPERSPSKEKAKYVVSRTVNRNMLVAVDLIKELKSSGSITNISNSDFESLIIKPLDKFLDGRVIRKPQERSNPFDTPRDVTESFIKLLNILKRQGMDITDIRVKNNQSSLSSASKLLRMYVSSNLEKSGKQIILDSTLRSLFTEKDIQQLCDKNGGNFITQGQIQKLASLLVIKSI